MGRAGACASAVASGVVGQSIWPASSLVAIGVCDIQPAACTATKRFAGLDCDWRCAAHPLYYRAMDVLGVPISVGVVLLPVGGFAGCISTDSAGKARRAILSAYPSGPVFNPGANRGVAIADAEVRATTPARSPELAG